VSAAADDLALALALADVADGITIGRFRANDLVVETKPDLTPVTEADRAVEHAIRERLAEAHPGDSILGEEYGASTAPASTRRWIVDPIDGTMSYVRGMPAWATLLALQDGEEISVGVVSAPALARRWWASRGQAAFADGRRIHVSGISELADAQLTYGGIEDWDAIARLEDLIELSRGCWRSRGVGDFWQYMLVAEGAAEIALDAAASLWDLAAVQLIVEQAGGRFTDLGGARTADGGDAIATNGSLHEAALAIIGR
jgi:histidinol-phosphatase